MKENDYPTLNMIKTSMSSFFHVLLPLLIFEVFYKLLCTLIFQPLLDSIMQGVLSLTGYSLAFNEQMAGFYTNFIGIFSTLLLFLLECLFAYFEFSVIILMIYYGYIDCRLTLMNAMKLALTTFKSLKSIGIIGFVAYALGLLPFVGMGLAPSIHPSTEIPNFISGELYKTFFGSALMYLFYVAMYVLFFATVLLLPIMILRRKKFLRSLRISLTLLKTVKLRNALPVVLIFALWSVLFVYPGILPDYYTGISDASVAEFLGNFFFIWKSMLQFMFVTLIKIVLSLLLFTFVTTLYVQCSGRVDLGEEAMPVINRRLRKTKNILGIIYGVFSRGLRAIASWLRNRTFYQNYKKPIWVVVCILLFLGVFSFLYHQPNSYEQLVIGHRGSQTGVENTLQAVNGAIDAKADSAEVDILLSSDGVPMVIHDDNLKRLSGENINVYDKTAAELSRLTLTQGDKKGKISTLEEVIDYSRGKIDLLIELKLHGKEKVSLVQAVTHVVERNHFQKNCKIMSLEYDLIEELKANHPEYEAGYCVYGNLGQAKFNSLRSLGVDFLIIEESMASKSFISQCNKAFLPVYVWTVNKELSMTSYFKMGAVGIITDKPKVGRSVADAYMEK